MGWEISFTDLFVADDFLGVWEKMVEVHELHLICTKLNSDGCKIEEELGQRKEEFTIE